MTALLLIVGLAALIGGAELLVRGASKLALSFGISPLVVGLTVVAFGTSTPELAVSLQSAHAGRADIALGNVVGSNIMNVLLILGASALITPLLVAQQLIRQEVPIMIGFFLLLLLQALDGSVSRYDGALLSVLLGAYTLFIIRQSRRQGRELNEEYAREFAGEAGRGGRWDRHWAVQLLLVAGGLALLVLGAHWLVDAAVAIARHFGMSEMIIGLTIVAIGTSLPEVATSLMAALRGERDIAVGNVVGSNIFNVAGVLGVSSLLAPGGLPVQPAMLSFDLPVMVTVGVACLPIFFTGNLIARWEGGLFFGFYVGYIMYLILAARQHDALSTYGWVMAVFVLPIAGATLLVVSWREWRARGGVRLERRGPDS